MHRLAAPIAIVVAAALSLAGCGDDDAGGSGSGGDLTVTTSSLAKPQFIKQGEEICSKEMAKVIRELGGYQKENGPVDPTNAGVEVVNTILLPHLEAQIAGLQDLGAPSGDEAEIEAFLVAKQDDIERTEEESLTSNRELITAFRASDKLAHDYGLTNCAYN